MVYDLVIIGAGPAGLTAGLYSARNGLKTAIVSNDIGGTTNSIWSLENWPGFSGSGSELIAKIFDHLKKYNIQFIISEVESIIKKEKTFLVKTSKGDLKSRTVIIATGTERKRLKIPGEDRLKGNGVSYCATCDSYFYKNKIVGVIGGSDCAIGSALALSDIAKKVYVIYRGEKLRCEDISLKKLEKRKNVESIYNALPLKLNGEKKLESIDMLENNKKRIIKLAGIFIEIGSTPLTEVTKGLKLKIDKNNFIKVDADMNTSVSGIFACGDVTAHKLKQVIVAAGQGAIAARSAYEWLSKQN